MAKRTFGLKCSSAVCFHMHQQSVSTCTSYSQAVLLLQLHGGFAVGNLVGTRDNIPPKARLTWDWTLGAAKGAWVNGLTKTMFVVFSSFFHGIAFRRHLHVCSSGASPRASYCLCKTPSSCSSSPARSVVVGACSCVLFGGLLSGFKVASPNV
jgi:hypothetical protein